MKYLFIGLLWIPFVLLTDLFPFMRFGMFAEPIKTDKQTEVFIVTSQIGNFEREITEQELGIKASNFNYLARNYHYKNKDSLLLQNIAKALKLKSKNSLKLKKVVINSVNKKTDTTTVYTYIQP